jgi:cyclic-di-GMP-binding protein
LNARDKWELDNLGFSMRMSNTARQAAVKKSEAWQILNQSATGFMCLLRDPSGVMRMMHNQVIGIRHGTDQARLGTIQWIRVDSRNETLCGVRLFPGGPQPVRVRPANFNLPQGKGQAYELAFLTPAVTMPASPISMLLPAGWFQSGRLLELHGAVKRVAKLLTLIERGADYDRCAISFEP